MVQGGMSIVKYLMFIFNFVFVVCALALIIIGAIAQTSGRQYTDFLDGGKFGTAPVILIILGVVIFFIAFLGCWGAMRENHCMVATFGVLMFIIFIIEMAAGITAYVYRNELETALHTGMNKTFTDRWINKEKEKLCYDLEKELKCCGVNGFSDYKNGTEPPYKLPQSCCKNEGEGKECMSGQKDVFGEGCFKKLEELLRNKITIVGGVGFGIAAVEVLGMLFAWCLATAIKKEYEGV